MGVLNSQGRFFAAALGPAILNVGMIAAVLALAAPRRAAGPLARARRARGRHRPAPGPGARACAGVGLLAAPSGELRHPGAGPDGAAAPARRVRPRRGAGDGLRQHAAGLAAAGGLASRSSTTPTGSWSSRWGSSASRWPRRRCRRWRARPPPATRAAWPAPLNFALRLAVYVSVPATVGLVLLSTPDHPRAVRARPLRPRATPRPRPSRSSGTPSASSGFAGARIAAQAFYAMARAGGGGAARCARHRRQRAGRAVLMGPMGHAGLAARLVDRRLREPRRPAVGGAAPLRSTRRPRPAAISAARTLAGERCRWLLWCVLLRYVAARPAGSRTEAAWLAVTIAGGAVVFVGASALLGSPGARSRCSGMLPSRRRR